jgi:hypothetical protein
MEREISILRKELRKLDQRAKASGVLSWKVNEGKRVLVWFGMSLLI